jgi:(E)-4-hydroxy-3-methyl-but-2-enyl pyrophosphate reductase
MKIILAKSSGFCMGVRRAVELVLDTTVDRSGPVYTFGPLIHNPQVLKVLEEKGIQILKDVPVNGSGTVLIRAHGVPPEIKDRLTRAGYNIIDATCPRVIKIQTIIKKYTDKGHEIIIFGDQNHPEVVGLYGHANRNGHVVEGLDQLEALPRFDHAIVVAQTTQNTRTMEDVKTWVQNTNPHYKVFETICDSTEKRQTEVKKFAHTVDAVVVVGGRNSGNTRRLAEIAKESGKPVFHVETEDDFDTIDVDKLASAAHVGITAGASTPNWIINKVHRALERLPYKRNGSWRRYLFNIQRLLLLTNIYVSLGAGCLSYACTRLLGVSNYWPHIAIPILYVQSMHLFNHLTGVKADKFNDPDRAAFYEKNRGILTALAMVAGGIDLLAALMLGIWPFILLLAMSLTGMSYNLRMLPDSLQVLKYHRIRDFPGSKTILISMAWGVIVVLLPSVAQFGQLDWVDLLLFVWFAGLVFVRTAFFDILDMQGDRLIGKESMAIMLGEKRMVRVLEIVLATLIVLMPLASVLGVVPKLGFGLTLCPIFMLVIINLYKKRDLLPGIRLEFMVETLFILAGVITAFWPYDV